MSLQIQRMTRLIRMAKAGRLQPWLGPALRGLTGGRLRARTCQLPVYEQITTKKYCLQCPQMKGCAYGETYEPDPPLGLLLATGWENTARPFVISPSFPLPEVSHPGLTFPVTMTFCGQKAISHAAQTWESLRIGGADQAIGLGDDHLLFDVLPSNQQDQIDVIELPTPDEGEHPAMLSSIRVFFTSPLFLKQELPNGKKVTILKPTFGELIRAGLRVLGPLHKVFTQPIPEHFFRLVKEAAEAVPTINFQMMSFDQTKFSHRTKNRYELDGTYGEAEYGPLPEWLLPWLNWAGIIHVGTHRIAGAGGWVVTCNR